MAVPSRIDRFVCLAFHSLFSSLEGQRREVDKSVFGGRERNMPTRGRSNRKGEEGYQFVAAIVNHLVVDTALRISTKGYH